MAERSWEKRLGGMWIRAYLVEPTLSPLQSVELGFDGESESFALRGLRVEEELRDLQYAIGRLLAEVEESRGRAR